MTSKDPTVNLQIVEKGGGEDKENVADDNGDEGVKVTKKKGKKKVRALMLIAICLTNVCHSV
jgi:hypothetical protein